MTKPVDQIQINFTNSRCYFQSCGFWQNPTGDFYDYHIKYFFFLNHKIYSGSE